MDDKTRDIRDSKERLVEAFRAKLSNGIESMDAQEAGEVTDMIKDLAEAEKECYEAAYYQKLVEQMEKPEEPMGYDDWRYASGRFAPKGRGTRDGYNPYPIWGENMGYDDQRQNDRMGNTVDPIDKMAEMWGQADYETKRRMKSALEEMTRALD